MPLPPALQALKDAAAARHRTAEEAARQDKEVRAAMNRDKLAETIDASVDATILNAIGDIDLSEVGADTGSFNLVVEFPGHRPLLASFSRHSTELKWQRQEFAVPRSIWSVRRKGSTQYFLDLGEALLFAELSPEQIERERARSEETSLANKQALDEIPF